MTLPYRMADCPAAVLMNRMSNRWTIPVMALISEEPIRFNQLRREVEGISQRMLSQTLKTLERDGLVNRVVTPTVPITVEYTLTKLGRTLIDAFSSVLIWSEVNFPDVAAAQARFDQRQYGRADRKPGEALSA